MIKQCLLISKKFLTLSVAALVAIAAPFSGVSALTSKELFERIPDSVKLSGHGEYNPWDLYSNIYSLKQCGMDLSSSSVEREFRTPITETIVNATKIWSGPGLGTAIATQSPGGDVFNTKDLFPRFLSMLAEVENPYVVVLGPADAISVGYSKHGSILDYFTDTGVRCLKPHKKIPGSESLSSRLGVPRVEEGASQYTLGFKARTEDKQVPVTHFDEWEDSKIPGLPKAKDDLEKLICSFKDDTDSTLVVHCSAGVGRTGVFLACLYALKTGQTNPVEIVKYLREYRTNMVQKPEQFDYICKFILRNLCGMKDLPWDTVLNDEHFARMGIRG